MPNFLKFVVFICIIILLPLIVNIVDNLIKIFEMFRYNNCISEKIIKFTNKEFIEFILEFFERGSNYEIISDKEDIYLNDDKICRLLYYDNINCGKFDIYDAFKVIGVCESKGIKNTFIFTTKILSKEVLDFFESIKDKYDIKYIHGYDLNVNYQEFVCKFYSI